MEESVTLEAGSSSPSSLVAEASSSDTREYLNSSAENEAKVAVNTDGKQRRLNRRIALAALTDVPKLGGGSSKNGTIDLANEDDDPSNKWFAKNFASRLPKPTKRDPNGPLDAHFEVPKHIPPSIVKQARLKQMLQKSLAKKRREGQELRKQLYKEDNEHLLHMDEEDEEEAEFKLKKAKTRVKKPMDSDESEDDDDYKAEDDYNYNESSDSGEEEAEEEREKKRLEAKKKAAEQMDSKISDDLFMSPDRVRTDDEMSVNYLNDSFSYQNMVNGNGERPKWLGISDETFGQDDDGDEDEGRVFGDTQGKLQTSSSEDFADILSLCSGRFGTQFDVPTQFVNNESDNGIKFDMRSSQLLSDDEDDLLSGFPPTSTPKAKRTTKKVIDSDDDDDHPHKEAIPDSAPLPETVPLDEPTSVIPDSMKDGVLLDDFGDFPTGNDEEEPRKDKGRAVLDSSDEEDNQEEEGRDGRVQRNDEEEEAADDFDGDEQFDDDVEEEDEQEEEEEEAPNFDDEDDELAVIKRIEYNETKRKIKKKNFFDDEASLSGDDVGSDGDDADDDNDDYEAEEGDQDVVDADQNRHENHRLMLKQEADNEYRELVKLQERLLADGDLGGQSTNRTFRIKIRNDAESQLTLGVDAEGPNDDDGEDVEDDAATRAERVDKIKFRIEQSESMELFLDDVDSQSKDDPFERAAKIVLASKTSSNIVVIEKARPTLLSKTQLATTIKESITPSAAVPKQMYVRSESQTSNSNSCSSYSNSNSSKAPLKRTRVTSPTSGAQNANQHKRPSKLSALE